jgi:hypothetical protein
LVFAYFRAQSAVWNFDLDAGRVNAHKRAFMRPSYSRPTG